MKVSGRLIPPRPSAASALLLLLFPPLYPIRFFYAFFAIIGDHFQNQKYESGARTTAEFFLFNAWRVYTFAEKYNIDTLRRLSCHRLQQASAQPAFPLSGEV